jgi:hypothetical protein
MNRDVVELLIIIALSKADLSLIALHFYHSMSESGQFKISNYFMILGKVARSIEKATFWFALQMQGIFQ